MRESRLAKAILKNSLYPWTLQWVNVLAFAVIVHQLLLGPAESNNNLGSVLTWLLWWPALGVMFLLLGRVWCTVCPFALLSDVVRRNVGNQLRVPRLLKRVGPWLIIALFVLLTWSEEFFGIAHSPLATAALLLTLVTGVVAMGAFFERRAWCRYACPLGGMAGVYSRVGVVGLQGTPEACMACDQVHCYKGGEAAEGCPMFEFPRIMDGSANCTLCGHCVKNCPNDSLRVVVRMPSSELWAVSKPRLDESFLAALLAGLIAGLNLMEILHDPFGGLLGLRNTGLSFTLFFLFCLTTPMLLLAGAAKLASLTNADSVRDNAARFGYALLPVVLAGHIGHTGREFLEKGWLIVHDALVFATGEPRPRPASLALVGEEVQLGFQVAIYAVGLSLSLYAAWRIARQRPGPGNPVAIWLPYALLFVGFATLNVLLAFAGEGA